MWQLSARRPSVIGCVRAVIGDRHGASMAIGREVHSARLAGLIAPLAVGASLVLGLLPASTAAKQRWTPVSSFPASSWRPVRHIPIWVLEPTASLPPAYNAQLRGASCPSPRSCFAVGNVDENAVVEHWNGRRWAVQPIAAPPGALGFALARVSCSAANACTAVGISVAAHARESLLVERWNGRKWRLQSAPSPGDSSLEDVACSSRKRCVAVGETKSGDALVEDWNGSRWSIEPAWVPANAAYSDLRGVSCTSDWSCVAVGIVNEPPWLTPVAIAERWNGLRWSPQGFPAPQDSELNDVSCSSSAACTAVGDDGDENAALVERWDGEGWRRQQQPTMAHAGPDLTLSGVSCDSPRRCIAVGTWGDFGAGANIGYVESWNGVRWSRESASPPTDDPSNFVLADISCVRAWTCIAVGTDDSGPLVERPYDSLVTLITGTHP